MLSDARAAEDEFYNGLLNDAGDVDIESDTFLKSMVQEATLTQDLEGSLQVWRMHLTVVLGSNLSSCLHVLV